MLHEGQRVVDGNEFFRKSAYRNFDRNYLPVQEYKHNHRWPVVKSGWPAARATSISGESEKMLNVP